MRLDYGLELVLWIEHVGALPLSAPRLLEFSTKRYVLFTTYFMSSFQIIWYFQRTSGPENHMVKRYPNVQLFFRVETRVETSFQALQLYSTVVQLFHSLTGPRSLARGVSWASGARLPIFVFLNGFG